MTSDADGVGPSGAPAGDPGADGRRATSDAGAGAGADARAGAGTSPGAGAAGTADADDAGDGFGGRGWLLVAAVVVSTLVVPIVIYALPSLLPSLGLPYVAALLVLPMAPAALLGVVAVWSMAASGRR